MHRHLAALQGHLQRPVAQVTEQQQSVRVPRAELEAHRRRVVIGPPRQLQEAGGVEEDGEGVCLHAGEGQVALSQRGGEQERVTGRDRERDRERETDRKREREL